MRNEFSDLSKMIARWVGLMPAAPSLTNCRSLVANSLTAPIGSRSDAIVVLLVLPDRLIVGAEDERRAVDEEDVVAGSDRTVGLGHGARQ